MEKQNEQWLTLRDSKTKKYIKQIKINSEFVLKNDLEDRFLYVKGLINKIDQKYMYIIKSSTIYHLQGLLDLSNDGNVEKNIASNIKYNLQSDLNKLIDATTFDLETGYSNPCEIKLAIDAINHIYHLEKGLLLEIPGGTSSQNLTIEDKINNLNVTFNNYIKKLISDYNYQDNCLRWVIPQNYFHAWQISSAIEYLKCSINDLKNLMIIEKPMIQEHTELEKKIVVNRKNGA